MFAAAGFILIAGFFAIRFKWTNVSGSVDVRNEQFQKKEVVASHVQPQVAGDASSKVDLNITNVNKQIEKLSNIKEAREKNYCKTKVIGESYPVNAKRIVDIAEKTGNDAIITKAVMAVEIRMKNNTDFSSRMEQCDAGANGAYTDYDELKTQFADVTGNNAFSWINKPEWQTVKEAVKKDRAAIDEVGEKTGIEKRLIVASMMVEQLRLFYSEREVFKKFFEPLKILCSADKISLGVMGIKEETAINVENNLKDSSSPFYLGRDYEHLLDFNTDNATSERYNRLTDDKNHYYSYLYGALYLKEMMKQWKDAGYDIDYRPEIIGTLFNVGFPQSHPNPEPKVGGSHINVDNEDYSFGALSYEFYYSGELMDEFPYE